MTSNQIEYAKHLENVRHNTEMEKQGWHTAQSSRISSLASERTAYANQRNADSNARNVDVNWYNASTSRIDSSTKQQDAYTNARNADTNERNATTKEKEIWNQYVRTLGDLQNKRTELQIKQYESKTNRTNMWFNAINNAFGNVTRVGATLANLVK